MEYCIPSLLSPIEHAMRCLCPHCAEWVAPDRSGMGINVCPYCKTLFMVIGKKKDKQMPLWLLGAVMALTANLPIMFSLHKLF